MAEKAVSNTPEIGIIIDDAMKAIENGNKKLKNVLPKNYANPDFDKRGLGDLYATAIDYDKTAASIK